MSGWIKLHTGVMRDPKVAAMTAAQQVAWIRLLCWAGESAADSGYVPDGALRAIPMSRREMAAIESQGLAERNGQGWHISAWDKWQGGLQQQRANNRERQQAWRDRQKEASS